MVRNYIDEMAEKIAENERIASATRRMKPQHWFLAGGLTLFLIQLVFNFTLIIVEIFNFLGTTFMYQSGRFMGLTDEEAFRFIGIIFSDDAVPFNPYEFEGIFFFLTDYVGAFIRFMGHAGKVMHSTLLDYFPVLSEINFDINWMEINVSKILRSIFSIIQFVLILYISLKVKRYLKRKLKLDQDYFDKQYFGVIVV